jgi:FdrA protein
VIATVEIIAGRYYDSVRLMQVTRDVSNAPGVEEAMVAMATDLNRRLLDEMGFDGSEIAAAGPDDLLVAIRAVDRTAADGARAEVARSLTSVRAPEATALFAPPDPRTASAAARAISANLAVISVPGEHAFVEAMDAVRNGMHVMVFSDNVPVEQELLLKDEAAARNLLVMGPDCGTALVGGVGLGFANAVDPGPVAITGASGTGIQQLCVLLDAAGVGVRHALGTGSRDLSRAVGGASTLQAIAALDADPAVEVILVVSKPPDSEIGSKVREVAAACTTPTVVTFLGEPGVTLKGAASAVLEMLGRPAVEPPVWRGPRERAPEARVGVLRGFFSGGTLRDEAHSIATEVLGRVAIDESASGHRLVDYGSDEYTRGRAHPMIDPGLRLDGLLRAATDTRTGTILLDVVLGYGAHSDPAADLVPVVRTAVSAGVPVVISLCGTRRDPQGRERQATALTDAGAELYLSNAAAATRAAALVAEAAG